MTEIQKNIESKVSLYDPKRPHNSTNLYLIFPIRIFCHQNHKRHAVDIIKMKDDNWRQRPFEFHDQSPQKREIEYRNESLYCQVRKMQLLKEPRPVSIVIFATKTHK
jgi:hypothetical protein